MVQLLHGIVTTTEPIRRLIQSRQTNIRKLAGRHRVYPKTVAKWENHFSVQDCRI